MVEISHLGRGVTCSIIILTRVTYVYTHIVIYNSNKDKIIVYNTSNEIRIIWTILFTGLGLNHIKGINKRKLNL